MTVQYKQQVAHDLKLDEQGAISVAFAQLNVVDKDKDVTLPGAFPVKDVPMSAYGHTSWEGAPPIGRGSIQEAGEWAVFAGRFLMETDHGRNGYHTVKAMAELQEWSYGYDIREASFGQFAGQQVQFLKSLDVFEVSPVLVGAGVATHTLDIKAGNTGGTLFTNTTSTNGTNIVLVDANGTPLAGESFADQLDRVLGEVAKVQTRSASLAELRAKEGRVLSTASLERLSQLAELLDSAGTDLRAFLEAATTPKQRDADQVDILIEHLRLAGVTIG